MRNAEMSTNGDEKHQSLQIDFYTAKALHLKKVNVTVAFRKVNGTKIGVRPSAPATLNKFGFFSKAVVRH